MKGVGGSIESRWKIGDDAFFKFRSSVQLGNLQCVNASSASVRAKRLAH